MVMQHPPRASKSRFVVTMATPNNHSPGHDDKNMIKIPTRIWNAYQLQNQADRSHFTISASRAKPNVELSTRKDRGGKIQPTTAGQRPARPKNCKVKLWSFHHGGPTRVVKGTLSNEITYEVPCLQPTCANCRKWHPRLVHNQDEIEERVAEEEPVVFQPPIKHAIEPLSPEIDPRILDDTWRLYESRPGSAGSMQSIGRPALTPVEKSFENNGFPSPNQHHGPLTPVYDVFLPTFPLDQTTIAAPAETRWRTAPRQRRTLHLSFVSHEGKGKFRELLRNRERKARKREYDREYRARKLEKRRVRREY
jgi:hypothetical protein